MKSKFTKSLSWAGRRNISNKFIKKHRYNQHAWTDESFLLIPFQASVMLTPLDIQKASIAISAKSHSGSIPGSSYGNATYRLQRTFQFSKGKGAFLVSHSSGIGD